MAKVFIIAEAGINHNGSVDVAKKMICAALNAGVDAIKFQTFRAEKVVCKHAPKAEYQKEAINKDELQLEMLEKVELNKKAHRELIAYCQEKGIIFLSTPFDLESIGLLNDLGLEMFKISSGEITNLPYLRKVGKLKKKVIMSTGMANLGEIGSALDVLIRSGTQKEDITVLQCNTAYPTPVEDANLLAMRTIGKTFDIKVGYSDHTPGIEIAIAAVALGAGTIEKHFTLDRNMEGPDHKASLEPDELKSMVCAIRNVSKALGSGVKKPSHSELKNIEIVRKSIVASSFIKKGERFTKENITAKRPANGISPMMWDKIIGEIAKRDFKKDEFIKL